MRNSHYPDPSRICLSPLSADSPPSTSARETQLSRLFDRQKDALSEQETAFSQKSLYCFATRRMIRSDMSAPMLFWAAAYPELSFAPQSAGRRPCFDPVYLTRSMSGSLTLRRLQQSPAHPLLHLRLSFFVGCWSASYSSSPTASQSRPRQPIIPPPPVAALPHISRKPPSVAH